MSYSCSDIKSLGDLNKDSLRRLLQTHFKEEDITISDVGPFTAATGTMVGYCSEIKRATIKYRLKGGPEEPLHFIFKTPPNNVMKYILKTSKSLRREALWYTRKV